MNSPFANNAPAKNGQLCDASSLDSEAARICDQIRLPLKMFLRLYDQKMAGESPRIVPLKEASKALNAWYRRKRRIARTFVGNGANGSCHKIVPNYLLRLMQPPVSRRRSAIRSPRLPSPLPAPSVPN